MGDEFGWHNPLESVHHWSVHFRVSGTSIVTPQLTRPSLRRRSYQSPKRVWPHARWLRDMVAEWLSHPDWFLPWLIRLYIASMWLVYLSRFIIQDFDIFDSSFIYLKHRCQQSVLHRGVCFEVCFGGMFRRYVSGYVSPSLVDCQLKDYILYQRALSYTKLATGVVFWRGRLGHGTAKRGLGMIRGMYRVWFAVWFGQETVSAKIK